MNRNPLQSVNTIQHPTEPQPAILLEQVCKARRDHMIGPLNWSVPQGYVTALVGENGTGKSTLLHMLLRTVYPDRGDIHWFGHHYASELPIELRQQIAYIGDGSSPEENRMTAHEAAAFRAQWYPRWNAERFEQLLETLNVPSNARLSKVSKGQRQKFELAAALASSPRLLLLDEPSSGLDPFAWKDMLDVLHTYMDSGEITMIITTHRMEEVKRLADYVALMHHGQIVGMREKDELYQQWKEIWLEPHPQSGAADAELLRDWHGILEWEQRSDGSVRILTADADALVQIANENGITLQVRGLEWEELLLCWVRHHQMNVNREVQS
ncbi:ABC transporter ATP-binding protein [Paenibacillus kandeliae]|uniref:ABC transporter ATP-binding protein n=1 Tax=Paenibacillus kandeliae TaxID=3231269 RepID=UPI00345983FB